MIENIEWAYSAHRLLRKFGALTPLPMRLGLLALHPGEAKFLPRQIDRIMQVVAHNTDAIVRRKSPRRGRREREKILDGRRKITFGESRNSIKIYCLNSKIGLGKLRHRTMGAIFQLSQCVKFGLHPLTDLVSEFEILSTISMQSGPNGPWPERVYCHSSLALDKEPDGLIHYRDDPGWIWIEVEGSPKNPERREQIARVNQMIGEGLASDGVGILAGEIECTSLLLLHGFPRSFPRMVQSLDMSAHPTIHQFLYLNPRLGIDFYDLDQQLLWPNESMVWDDVGLPLQSPAGYRRDFAAEFLE